MTSLAQYGLDWVTEFGSMALAGVGFALIYRICGYLHFAYGGVWTFSATSFGWALDSGWSPISGFLFSCVVSSALALACYFLYARIDGKLAEILASFGILVVIVAAAQLIFGVTPRGYDPDRGLASVWTWSLDGGRVSLLASDVVAAGLAIISGIFIAWVLGRTNLGMTARAMSENPAVAASTGIRTVPISCLVFIAGTTLGTLSAALHVVALGSSLSAGMEVSLEVVAVAVLAGPVVVGVLPSTAIFAALLVLANVIAGPEYVTLIGYAGLFLLIRFLRTGLFDRDIVWRPSRVEAQRLAGLVRQATTTTTAVSSS